MRFQLDVAPRTDYLWPHEDGEVAAAAEAACAAGAVSAWREAERSRAQGQAGAGWLVPCQAQDDQAVSCAACRHARGAGDRQYAATETVQGRARCLDHRSAARAIPDRPSEHPADAHSYARGGEQCERTGARSAGIPDLGGSKRQYDSRSRQVQATPWVCLCGSVSRRGDHHAEAGTT